MENRWQCSECAAITAELAQAYTEAWSSGNQDFRDSWLATYKMIGETEDDFARAEELPSFPASHASERINRAFLEKFAHEARSGHRIVLSAEL